MATLIIIVDSTEISHNVRLYFYFVLFKLLVVSAIYFDLLLCCSV